MYKYSFALEGLVLQLAISTDKYKNLLLVKTKMCAFCLFEIKFNTVELGIQML